ncbi:hypothetical protein, conserved [Eimeria tenella]|uniref:Uncharacterized protein n=1 Tax=Eimeria tenella TaxID=5802 RepID=U6KWL1_EIMTE|nr:hypothetical protein, conserved [Eimeria tenella]CDJ42361.1 hypothetical protein, conserved [Eimeria tenella]|eukprot:XP_013233111.1 hypothetical protein, conserved [Eimeria tenella]
MLSKQTRGAPPDPRGAAAGPEFGGLPIPYYSEDTDEEIFDGSSSRRFEPLQPLQQFALQQQQQPVPGAYSSLGSSSSGNLAAAGPPPRCGEGPLGAPGGPPGGPQGVLARRGGAEAGAGVVEPAGLLGLEKEGHVGEETCSNSGSPRGDSSSSRRSLWQQWAEHNLNLDSYGGDLEQLYLDCNGWKPRAAATAAAAAPAAAAAVAPKFKKQTAIVNPPLVNTMDARHQHGLLYTATEAAEPAAAAAAASSLNIYSAADLSLIQTTQIQTKAINCLDVTSDLLACGDDNGCLHFFDPFTLQRRSKLATAPAGSWGFSFEINDLRICRGDGKLLAVQTARRYPFGFLLLDISSQKALCFSDRQTNGYWLHAVDVEPSPFCPYGSSCCCCSSCSSSSSSVLRSSSSSSIFAVGESSATGIFSLLHLDCRLQHPVVMEVKRNKQMLWPLRVQDYNVFVNDIFPQGDFEGRIEQIDFRMTHSSNPPLAYAVEGQRVEDIRLFKRELYVLSSAPEGEMAVWRPSVGCGVLGSGSMGSGSMGSTGGVGGLWGAAKGAQRVAAVDRFDAHNWKDPLKLLLLYETTAAAAAAATAATAAAAGPADPAAADPAAAANPAVGAAAAAVGGAAAAAAAAAAAPARAAV